MNQDVEEGKNLNLENIWTTIYCCCLLFFFPLFMKNGYLDIMEAKTNFFLAVTVLYIVGMLMIFAVKKIQEGTNIFSLRGEFGFIDCFCILLIIDGCLGFILNRFHSEILWAKEGKLFGFIFLFLCLAAYFFVARTFQMNQGILWGALLGSIFTSIFVICSRFGIDVFHLYDMIVKNERAAFLGTLGQINVVASFFCIFIPFWIGCYLFSKDRTSKLLFGIALFLSIMAGISSNSDSVFLGIVAAYLCYLWFAFMSTKRLSAYLQCGSILCLSFVVLKIFTYMTKTGYAVKWDKLQNLILNQYLLWIILAILLGAGSVFLKREFAEGLLIKIRTIIFIIIASGIIVAIIMGIANQHSEVGNMLQKYIVFNDFWGTNRGYVWKRTVQLYGKLPIEKKLIGCGMGMFPQFFKIFHADALKQFGYYFVDAHNEFLQFLVTTGIIGCISYFGMIITTIVKNLSSIERRKQEDGLPVITGVILIVWIIQGLVNSPTVFITPYLFLFMGIGQDIFTQNRGKVRS